MAVKVTIDVDGESVVENHDRATNYEVDQNGHLHLTNTSGSSILEVAGYASGTWHKVVVSG